MWLKQHSARLAGPRVQSGPSQAPHCLAQQAPRNCNPEAHLRAMRQREHGVRGGAVRRCASLVAEACAHFWRECAPIAPRADRADDLSIRFDRQ
eukprot:3891210-Pleurochrysis_carterae.AAC.2